MGLIAARASFTPRHGEGGTAVLNRRAPVGGVAKGTLVKTSRLPFRSPRTEPYVVVTTGDAVLICPKSKAQDVRKIVDQLKADQREDLL